MKLFKYIFILLPVLFSCSGDGITPELEEALYHFYTGQSYQREHKYYDAMEEFLQAEELSASSDKVVLKGQICSHKGALYAQKMDYSNALDMFSRALDFYQLAGTDVREHIMYAYEGMARIYAADGNVQESINYYRKASQEAVQMRSKMLFSPHDSVVVTKENLFNDALMRYSTAIAALYCRVDGGEDKALAQLDSTYNKFNDSIVNPLDYPLLAKIYLKKGDVKKSSGYLKDYSEKVGERRLLPDEQLQLYDIAAKVALAAGDYKGASRAMDRYIYIMDSVSLAARSESVREAEQQFWQRRLEEENYNVKVRSYSLAAVYSFIVAIMVVAGVFVVRRYRERMEEKNTLLAQYADNIESLGTRVASAENSRENLLSQLDIHKAKEKELKELLENRFAEVKELVRTYYESGNSKKLHKKVDDLLKLQLSGDNFEVMEQVVNAKNNDVIRKVREMYPNMKEDNIKLLNLIYAGFSAQEISVILNDTPQNIYVRKSRLKKSLQELILGDPQMNFS